VFLYLQIYTFERKIFDIFDSFERRVVISSKRAALLTGCGLSVLLISSGLLPYFKKEQGGDVKFFKNAGELNSSSNELKSSYSVAVASPSQ